MATVTVLISDLQHAISYCSNGGNYVEAEELAARFSAPAPAQTIEMDTAIRDELVTYLRAGSTYADATAMAATLSALMPT